MNKIIIYLTISFSILILISCSNVYHSVNNYSKLSFVNDAKFYYDYFDNGNDTSFYKVKGDTIWFTSSVQPVKFYKCNTLSSSDTLSALDINLKVYTKNGFLLKDGKFIFQNGELLKDTVVKMDTLNRIYVNKLSLHEGQLVSFEFFSGYRYIVPKDTTFTGYFELDVYFGRRVYFNNYPLLMQNGYLLPFDEEANEYFRKINGFEFLPMRKGKKNQKYKTYLSGFGEIH